MQNKYTENEQFIKKEQIFDKGFEVDEMKNPTKYLPSYQQNRANTITANEQCLVCCGGIFKFFAIPFALCACECQSCVYRLPTSSAGLVESFGRFNQLLKPGFNMINPCADTVIQVDLRAKIMEVGRHSTITKDNVKLTVQACVAFRATNPILAHYTLGANMNRAVGELTVSSLRQIIGDYTLDEVLKYRSKLSDQAKERVKRSIPKGIEIENIFIEDISIPVDIQKDLTSAARQRRLGQATIINSQADVQSAALMKQSAQLLDNKAAMQIRYLEMVTQLGKNGVVLMMEIGAQKKGYKSGS